MFTMERLCNVKQTALQQPNLMQGELLRWHIFPQTVENQGQTFLMWNVNRGTFLTVVTNCGCKVTKSSVAAASKLFK